MILTVFVCATYSFHYVFHAFKVLHGSDTPTYIVLGEVLIASYMMCISMLYIKSVKIPTFPAVENSMHF